MKLILHDGLHSIIDGRAALKERSDKIHSLPSTDSIEEWAERKREMVKIYSEAVGCEQVSDALEFADEMIAYIRQYASTLEEWRQAVERRECSETVMAIAKKALKNKKCFSPGGNDYACFCGKK